MRKRLFAVLSVLSLIVLGCPQEVEDDPPDNPAAGTPNGTPNGTQPQERPEKYRRLKKERQRRMFPRKKPEKYRRLKKERQRIGGQLFEERGIEEDNILCWKGIFKIIKRFRKSFF